MALIEMLYFWPRDSCFLSQVPDTVNPSKVLEIKHHINIPFFQHFWGRKALGKTLDTKH